MENQGGTTMDMVQSSLAAGDYVAAIQDELGNMGASVTMFQPGVAVAGTVGVAPSSTSQSSYASQPAAIVSLSPAAQNILSGAQIALHMITAARQSEPGARASAPEQNNNTDAASAKPGSTDRAPTLVQPSTGDVISSRSDPSIADIVKQAQSTLNDPSSVFYNIVNQAGGPEKWSYHMDNEQDQQSFIDAFNNKTLIVENASNVAGLDYQDNTVLTGISENVRSSESTSFLLAQNAAGYQTGLMQLPVIGGIYFAWKDPKMGNGADTAPVASGNP
ncbi:MAG TPA: hypothetical protein VGL95_15460 [Acetobacteraceae bacterium]|jgi:predicted TIM-barrel enzyme